MAASVWILGSLLGCIGEVGGSVEPVVCASADHTPDVDAARQGLAWVYRNDLANGSVPTCPAADDPESWKVGFLFDVTDEDCPKRAVSACDAISGSDRFPRTARLFDSSEALRLDAVSAGGDRVELPDALARYCVYYSPSGDLESPIQGDQNNPVQVRAVVDPAATPAEVEAVYDATSQAEVGFCPVAAKGASIPVRLTLLDNAPTKLSGGGELHGYDLQAVVSGLCSGGECQVEVQQRMAMPLVWNDGHDWRIRDGGDYGSLDWLAQSIVREVESWANDPAHERLVLNLSMAWHGEWNGDVSSLDELPADVLAVYDALRYARCNGALIVTAAGNRTGCGYDTTPMFPAAWESVQVGPNSCGGFLRDDDVLFNDVPLVYAVGGLVDQDASIALARDDNQPFLAAYARDVVVPGSPRTITGTSVGSALVAADAARRWSAAPGLTADEVMAEVFRSAEPTGLPAEGAHFTTQQAWFDGLLGGTDPATVRRVASCGSKPSIPTLAWESCGLACDLVRRWSGAGADAAYPFGIVRPRPNIQPFANPTPMTKPCDLCGFDAVPNRAFIQLGPEIVGTVAGHLAIDSASSGWSMWPLGSLNGSLQEFQVDGAPCDATRAVLMFDYEGVGYMSEVHVIGAPTCGP